jgi:hypothetical protein
MLELIVSRFTDEENPPLTQLESQEKSLALHLGHIINGFHEIVQTILPIGASVENTVKQLTRLYNALVLFTKYVSPLTSYSCLHSFRVTVLDVVSTKVWSPVDAF